MNRVRLLTRAAAACACLLPLSGCISLLPETEPSTIYRLELPLTAREAAAPGAPVISVDRPLAPRALTTDRIALSYEGGRIAYIADTSWASPAPDLVQALVLDALDAHAGLVGSRPDDGVEARYQLRLDMRAFEARQIGAGAPEATISLRARLVDGDTRQLVAVRNFDARAQASAERASAIVAAFEQASAQAAQDLAGWIAETLPEADS